MAPLILWVLVFPLLVPLAAAWTVREGLRRTKTGAKALDDLALRWAGRLGLAVIFAVGLLDLGRDTAELI